MTDDNSAYTEVHRLHPFPSVSMALPVDSVQQMWFHRKAQTGAFRKMDPYCSTAYKNSAQTNAYFL